MRKFFHSPNIMQSNGYLVLRGLLNAIEKPRDPSNAVCIQHTCPLCQLQFDSFCAPLCVHSEITSRHIDCSCKSWQKQETPWSTSPIPRNWRCRHTTRSYWQCTQLLAAESWGLLKRDRQSYISSLRPSSCTEFSDCQFFLSTLGFQMEWTVSVRGFPLAGVWGMTVFS